MKRAIIIVSVTSLITGNAWAQSVEPGSYLCEVEQMASINSTHLEDAQPPQASGGPHRYRFRIAVSAEAQGDRLIVEEAPYDGPERSQAQWEDENSTLHAPYVGSGYLFNAIGDVPGFLRFMRDRRWGDELKFYHAGFQFAGGEDTHLTTRWGHCTRE